MSAPQCPICHPPTFTYDPPEESLRPEACPARGNHAIITRAFEYLWRMEARLSGGLTSGRTELAAAAQARADIDRLRNTRVEHAQLMSGGGMHVRWDDPEVERIFPLDQWIKANSRGGGRVFRRTIVVIEEWTEVTDVAPTGTDDLR